MKHKIFYGVMMVAAGMLSATSCTDFDDYNEARHDANPSADQTLWANISSDSNLTHFASLLKKAGYDKVLNSANSYTVWAPVDGALDLAQYENMDSAQLVLEFVKNHVANYNYVVSGTWDEPKRIRMQNDKAFDFVSNGTCTFDGINVVAKNLMGSNGVLHKIEGVAKYFPSLSAFLSDTTKSHAAGVDSLSAYYRKYNISYLDEDRSVVGPIVDGKQTYIDSVMVVYNSLADRLRARVSNEDSTYVFFMPTNQVWNKELEKAKKYYAFKEKIPYQAVDNAGNLTDQIMTVSKLNYLRDSLAHEDLVEMLTFSANNGYNKGLIDGQVGDTLQSTSRLKYSDPKNLLNQVVAKHEMSNGYAYVIDSMAFHPWDTYSREMTVEAGIGTVLKVSLGSGSRTSKTYTNDRRDSRTYRFYYVQPSGTSSPVLDMQLPNVKSDTYNIYAVFAPGYTATSTALDTLPNMYKFTLHYSQTGNNVTNTSTWRFSSDGVENPSSETKQQAFIIDNSYAHRTDATGMLLADTVLIGKMTFPVSYYGTGVGPNLQVKVPYMTKANREKYSREIRLISVILRPVVKDEYEATKED